MKKRARILNIIFDLQHSIEKFKTASNINLEKGINKKFRYLINKINELKVEADVEKKEITAVYYVDIPDHPDNHDKKNNPEITKIETFMRTGEYAHILFIRVYKNNQIWKEIPANKFTIEYKIAKLT